MGKLENYQLERLKELTEAYLKEPSKISEFGISQIKSLDGGDLLNLLDYIKKEYLDPHLRQERILYEEKEEELEKEKEEFKERLEEKLNRIRNLWNKIQSSKTAEEDLSDLLNG